MCAMLWVPESWEQWGLLVLGQDHTKRSRFGTKRWGFCIRTSSGHKVASSSISESQMNIYFLVLDDGNWLYRQIRIKIRCTYFFLSWGDSVELVLVLSLCLLWLKHVCLWMSAWIYRALAAATNECTMHISDQEYTNSFLILCMCPSYIF